MTEKTNIVFLLNSEREGRREGGRNSSTAAELSNKLYQLQFFISPNPPTSMTYTLTLPARDAVEIANLHIGQITNLLCDDGGGVSRHKWLILVPRQFVITAEDNWHVNIIVTFFSPCYRVEKH